MGPVDRGLGAELKGHGYKSGTNPNWVQHTEYKGKMKNKGKGGRQGAAAGGCWSNVPACFLESDCF